MRFKVNIRFDASTGRFEEFLVESLGQQAADGTHDDAHEALAALLGEQIELGAQVVEVFPNRPDPNSERLTLRQPVGTEAADTERAALEGGQTA